MSSGIAIRTRILAALGQPEALLTLARKQSGPGASTDAIERIAAAARAGLPDAQTQLGRCYLHGQGLPRNLGEARHWLERAAGAGDAGARIELASLALQGISGPYERGPFAQTVAAEPDRRLAADLARRAAETGSAEAQALLAYILNQAPEMAETPDEADTLYRQAAEAGWPLGQLGHAMALLKQGTSESTREASVFLTQAAGSGLPTASFMLGALAESGVAGDVDLATAAGHYRAGAEHNHTGSKTRLGLALLNGRGAKRNTEEAETWLRRAANDGDAIAAAQLGDFFASPQRGSPNPAEAAAWYRRAAGLGHAGSARALARALSAGAEGAPHAPEIAGFLQQAIEGGEAAAWSDIAAAFADPGADRAEWRVWFNRMLREGRAEAGLHGGILAHTDPGGPEGEKLARRLYLRAASLGSIEGMAAAAEMLLNGRGGSADRDLAVALFAFAAKRNHAGANFALGILASGDPDRALIHFQRAAALGHVKAAHILEAA